MSALSNRGIFILIVMLSQAVFATNDCDSRNSEWQCDNGECIQQDEHCDGIIHCNDGSDETAENCIHLDCPSFAFRCAYGGCVNGNYRCNGHQDCADNSDETDLLCYADIQEIEEKSRGNCSSLKSFQCLSGECVEFEKSCNGIRDCADGSDETVRHCGHMRCPPYTFRCGYGACIPRVSICDGTHNCADGSDEASALCHYPRKRQPTKSCCLIPHISYLITKIANRNVFVNGGTHVENGTIVKFHCSNDMEFIGVDINECLNGEWRYALPSCRATAIEGLKYCPQSILTKGISTTASCFFRNESVSCDAPQRVGTTASIECAPGYELQNKINTTKELHCQQNGEWDNQKFKCTPVCRTFSSIDRELAPRRLKHRWTVSIFKYDSTVYNYDYICEGHIISPNFVLTCSSCVLPDWNDDTTYAIVDGFYPMSFNSNSSIPYHRVRRIRIPKNTSLDGIALIKIADYFKFGETLAPKCLDFSRFSIGLPRDRDSATCNVDNLSLSNHRRFLENSIKQIDMY